MRWEFLANWQIMTSVVVVWLYAAIDCNIDKSIKNFPISSARKKGLQAMLTAL